MSKFLLPQDDSSSNRAATVEAARAQNGFKYDQTYPIGTNVWKSEEPGPEYGVKFLKNLYERRANIRRVLVKAGYRFAKPLPGIDVKGLVKILTKGDQQPLLDFFLPDLGVIQPSGRPASADDYARMFARDAMPDIAKDPHSDATFANIFLGGVQFDSLRRLSQPIAKFPISDAQFQAAPALAGDSLAAAMQDGRVYYVDFDMMAKLKNASHPQQAKYMYAPVVGFAVPKGGAAMVPFAVQIGQEPQGREIYCPRDDWSWKIACAMTRAAANAHASTVTHLATTHLVIEPIIVCTHRNMAVNHPLAVLLSQHFTNTMHTNQGVEQNDTGLNHHVDRLIGSTLRSNYDMITDARMNFDFTGNYLPARLKARQVDDAGKLPGFSFRDDAVPLWAAINEWVSNYVAFYYRSEAAVQQDRELQNWAREIADPRIGALKGFAGNGSVRSRQELIDTVTMIIFTAGPQHSVANFGQSTDMAHVPSAPWGGYIPEITGKGHTEADWLNFLPPLDIQLIQVSFCNVLGTMYHTTLGGYEVAFDDGVNQALAAYKAKLASIEQVTLQANQRRIPLIHLLPSRIPRSINI